MTDCTSLFVDCSDDSSQDCGTAISNHRYSVYEVGDRCELDGKILNAFLFMTNT